MLNLALGCNRQNHSASLRHHDFNKASKQASTRRSRRRQQRHGPGREALGGDEALCYVRWLSCPVLAVRVPLLSASFSPLVNMPRGSHPALSTPLGTTGDGLVSMGDAWSRTRWAAIANDASFVRGGPGQDLIQSTYRGPESSSLSYELLVGASVSPAVVVVALLALVAWRKTNRL